MNPIRTGLFWFTDDLRLGDQPALRYAAQRVDVLLCVYVLDEHLSQANMYGLIGRGQAKQQFISESLQELQQALTAIGQQLHIAQGNSTNRLTDLIETYGVTHVFRSRSSGFNENRVWKSLIGHNQLATFHETESTTLFEEEQLTFDLVNLPATFTKFRKAVEGLEVQKPIGKLYELPPPPNQLIGDQVLISKNATPGIFQGGEISANRHLDGYFSGDLPAHYKLVRNALDGWDNSCKFSPWLANGCVSVRQIMQRLQSYEVSKTANDSTYWIFFELLWREYFHLNARCYGNLLFRFSGTKNRTPLTSFYPERFKKWCVGNTPYPIVNACMRELSETGYLSNRGRQIVASCLVNELQLDWRYGAAYFEKMLIDYDVASNWGNWQYLAGVGADAQEKRHFNLVKQTELFDPNREYIGKWAPAEVCTVLDSVDAADWPIA